MSEPVVISRPGVCEHVTKMGRLDGKGQKTKKDLVPQFRSLPKPRERHTDIPDEGIIAKTVPVGQERSYSHGYRPPYVEMKLGRNMRAAPKGSFTNQNMQSDLNSQQLDSVPLLTNQPSPSNNIITYFNTTHVNQTTKSLATSLTSRQYPARSINSPQHPSQDFIEMLNKNSQIIEARIPAVSDRQDRIETEMRRKTEEQLDFPLLSDKFHENVEISASQEHESPPSQQEETILKEPFGVNTTVSMAPPPPVATLYSSYRVKKDYLPTNNASDQETTQPFFPQGNDFQSNTNTATGSFTAETSVTNPSTDLPNIEKQETIDEVDDITEDIKPEADSDTDLKDDDLKDDDFKF